MLSFHMQRRLKLREVKRLGQSHCVRWVVKSHPTQTQHQLAAEPVFPTIRPQSLAPRQ